VDFRSAGGQQHDDDQRAASAEFRIRPHGGGGGGGSRVAVCTKTQNVVRRATRIVRFLYGRAYIHRPWGRKNTVGHVTLSRRHYRVAETDDNDEKRDHDNNDNKMTSRISASPFLPAGSNPVADGGATPHGPLVPVEIGRRVFLAVTGCVLLE